MRTIVTVVAAIATTFAIAATSEGKSEPTVASLSRTVQRQAREIKHLQGRFEPGGDLYEVIVRLRDKIDEHTAALRTPDVVKVVATQPVPEDGAATADALCPTGDQVLSGGYIHGAANG